MTKEQCFFIRILKDHLTGRETTPQDGLNWGDILNLAQIHEVGGIVYHQCKSFIPEEVAPELEKHYNVALFYYANRQKAMERIAAALKDMDFCAVKGLEVAQFYPFPSLRTMGDCDIAVVPEQFTAAIDRLRAAGFEGSADVDVPEWGCEYRRMHFELHHVLVEEREYPEPGQMEFFNNLKPYIRDGKVDWNYHFLFLLMHIRKHFMGNGVGIRQFIDLAVVLTRGPQLNWAWIEEKQEELNLRRFAHACYNLIENWFGVTAPVEYERIGADFLNDVTERILLGGVFGTADENNADNKAKTALMRNGRVGIVNRVRYLLSKLFPSYFYMKEYPHCEFLINRKYLLPAAWIRRFVFILCNKKNDARLETVKRTFISEAELAKRREIMEKMGL